MSSPGRRRPGSPKVQRAAASSRGDGESTATEQEIERTLEQLSELEERLQRSQADHRQTCDHICAEEQELREALALQKGQQRSASASVVRRYRSAENEYTQAEQQCAELRLKQAMLEKELSAAKVGRSGGAARELVRKRTPRRTNGDVSANSLSLRSSSLWVPWSADLEASCAAGGGPACPSSLAVHSSRPTVPAIGVGAGGAVAGSAVRTAQLPSLAEVRERAGGDTDLYTFYVQVFPLLRGAFVEAFRKPSKRYEARRLALSADFQRLELWPHSEDAGGSSAPLRGGGSQRGAQRRRLAEGFLRVEAIERMHVPRATRVAVRHALGPLPGAGAGGGGDAAAAGGTEAAGEAEAEAEEVSAPSSSAPVLPEPDPMPGCGADAVKQSQGHTYGPRQPSPKVLGTPLDDQVGGTNDSASGGTPSTHFAFDLMVAGADPWRLLATEVQTFQLVTGAVAALLAAKTSLPTYAMILGLGCNSPSSSVGLGAGPLSAELLL